MKYIDLTVLLNEDTPVYPGDPKLKIEPVGIFSKDSYTDHSISMGTHLGTHIDAPMHMIENGHSLEQMPVEQFVGKGRLIEVKDGKFDINQPELAKVEAGEIVLFHTGMDSVFDTDEYFKNSPQMPEELAEFLVRKKIKMVGADMGSPDHPPFKTHRILLGAGILIIENLTNLDKLVDKEFTVYALPIKLALDAAPARVIAQIN